MEAAEERRHTPGAKAPRILRAKRPKAKSLGYLEAKGSIRLYRFFYQAEASSEPVALVCATVQSGAPTLKRAKRRTEMFSPSFATLLAMSWPMVCDASLMKG